MSNATTRKPAPSSSSPGNSKRFNEPLHGTEDRRRTADEDHEDDEHVPETRALLNTNSVTFSSQESTPDGDFELGVPRQARFGNRVQHSGDADEDGFENYADEAMVSFTESNPVRSFWYILLLTVVIGGLQLSWSTEFSNGTVCVQLLNYTSSTDNY